MIFGTTQMCRKITIQSVKFNNEYINRADTIKYLGMKLDPSLTFKEHVNYVKGKTLGKIKLLGKVCSYIRPATALMLYKSLILPIFDYGDIIYDCISAADSRTLQVLQNMAYKFILGVPLLTSTAYIHKELDMLTLQERRTQHSATMMFQVDNSLCPPPVLRLFKRRLQITDRHTRMNVQSNFEIPRYRLELCRRNYVYRGIKLWYVVPYELKCAESLPCFKTNLRKYWLMDGDVDVT